MIWLLTFSLFSYALVILQRWIAWRRMPMLKAPASFVPSTNLTVIVPVRNEEKNIRALLGDLEHQYYPRELVEILVIDDHSEDRTVQLIDELSIGSTMSIRRVKLEDWPGLRFKKAAVQKGVELAQGELLVLTDGDCRVGREWLRQYAFLYETQRPAFISGPVCFHHTDTLFEKMQLVEFSSLIGIGGASIQLGQPNMCNGANLAYTREVFEKVQGFQGNENIASGDDEFLLHKVHQRFPGKVAFLKSREAIVYTEARKTLISFLSQRIRWASKWKAYQRLEVQLLALCVFLANLLLFISLPLMIWGGLPVRAVLAGYAVKFVVDFLFLKRVLTFLKKQNHLWYMLPLQLVYVPYVIFTGVAGLAGRYSWKGRVVHKS
ncbi:cellulose synthase/poly-beta-1,6-N-acetylglucosamine synthase-like glycosyltransferase [Pontibacter ummariensis]|uniref:Glycosyltransferase, catalytic subunit of cellulose synthase and poly-beta-1,6-N-acetylglucosamine synthase n=1 Tax=Pontibacter ummariensis TaxID=1610492 RepID=A0A239KNU3_9BACT|nr:glycosyltransferase [Pontibacter ummariensis]PRY05360.1 cellulose synthase/poly-beta-1,6-N-acetylglucosamine synthase-like glycosyltransferase [Pontibacter ummariensis]SNT19841.1 Glycosyltransferase, catalytic subunit of cellulose synthase and poly-beta-1,6-N-acetylglucosamine synthase [Pontibacter ummariensis]